MSCDWSFYSDPCYVIAIVIVTHTILLTKTTAAQNGVALSYLRVRGLYFLAVVFVAAICYWNCYRDTSYVIGIVIVTHAM